MGKSKSLDMFYTHEIKKYVSDNVSSSLMWNIRFPVEWRTLRISELIFNTLSDFTYQTIYYRMESRENFG